MLAVPQCVAGNQLGDIGARDPAVTSRPAGFSIVRTLVGHGVGREMHEDPQIPNYGKPGTGVLLEEGMVLAVEPMVTVGKHTGADGRRQLVDLLRRTARSRPTSSSRSRSRADGPRILTPWHEATGGRAAA